MPTYQRTDLTNVLIVLSTVESGSCMNNNGMAYWVNHKNHDKKAKTYNTGIFYQHECWRSPLTYPNSSPCTDNVMHILYHMPFTV